MLEHLHLSRRGLVRALLLAGGMKSGLLNAVRSADAMSRTPIVPGVQEFTDGDKVEMHVDMESILFFDPQTGLRLT